MIIIKKNNKCCAFKSEISVLVRTPPVMSMTPENRDTLTGFMNLFESGGFSIRRVISI